MTTLLKNCRLISPDIDLDGASLLLSGDRVERIVSPGAELPDAGQVLDMSGKIVAPGYLDIHCHGRGGADFSDGDMASFETIGNGKLADGVTGFLATTLSVSLDDITKTCRTAEEYRTKNKTGARLLGMHLEGPFFSPEGAGAQNPAFLRNPDIALVDQWNAICPVKKVSFSPELPGSAEFTRELVKRSIMPSGAHSLAPYETFEEMRLAGMKHLTHFCNVLTPLHHLKFGFVGGGLRAKDVYVEIITDGVHLCDEMIDLILMVKGCEKVMMITDSMRAAGMPDGDYSLGGLPVIVKNGRATIPSGRVAGSTLLYHNGVKHMLEVTHLPPKEIIKCTSWNQARSLGLTGYGRLDPGYHADLVVLDTQWNPLETWVGGVPRWRR